MAQNAIGRRDLRVQIPKLWNTYTNINFKENSF